jgi:predicted glycoside hydrolase/deacetylase ChbG (UPF0249 family)
MNATAGRLVLHADDLGMSRAVNAGIMRGFRHGLLTSSSLLANAPQAAAVLQQWKELAAEHAAGRLPSAGVRSRLGDLPCPFDLGVHLNLTQGRPMGSGYPAELLDVDGRFPGIFSLFARLWRFGKRFRGAIREELERQVQFVCNHGPRPTHLNGHQYVELFPTVADILPEIMERFGVKVVRTAWEPRLVYVTALKNCTGIWKAPLTYAKRAFARRFRSAMDAAGFAHPDAFFGMSNTGRVSLGLIKLYLDGAKGCRLAEVCLHPAEAADAVEQASAKDLANGWRDPLADRRPGELRMLVSGELPALLECSGWRLGRLGV